MCGVKSRLLQVCVGDPSTSLLDIQPLVVPPESLFLLPSLTGGPGVRGGLVLTGPADDVLREGEGGGHCPEDQLLSGLSVPARQAEEVRREGDQLTLCIFQATFPSERY